MSDYSLKWTARSTVLYKVDNDVSDADRPSEGVSDKAGGLSALNLPLLDKASSKLMLST